MDTATELPVYLESMKYDYGLDNVAELSIVLYKEPVVVEKDDVFVVPDEAKFIFYSNRGIKINKNFFGEEDYIFNPKKEIIPK